MEGISTTLDRSMDDVEARVREALAAAGFGILTEIDVAATLRAKLGVDRPPLKILGACNPALAHRALELDPTVSLLLPCNVVLEDVGDGRTHVAIADPRELLLTATVPNTELSALADDAAKRLEHAIDAINAA